MPASLARRTGTVGALVAAAGVTLVAGAWPALAAAPLDGRPAGAQAGGGAEQSAVVGPPTGLEGTSGQADAQDRGQGKGRDVPSPAPEAEPAAAQPQAQGQGQPQSAGQGQGQPRGQGQGQPRGEGPEQEAPQGAPADRGPQAGQPAAPAAAPVARPRSVPAAPVVRPVAPVAAPVAAPVPVMGPHVPSALASAGVRAGRPQVAAADPAPLRPTGAEPIALPAVVSKPQPVPTDLGRALPIVAAKTAAAVASTPEWPLGIVGVCLVFLLVQNRIDRRDPKLAQARLEDDAPLEFAPLDGRPHLRLVPAA